MIVENICRPLKGRTPGQSFRVRKWQQWQQKLALCDTPEDRTVASSWLTLPFPSSSSSMSPSLLHPFFFHSPVYLPFPPFLSPKLLTSSAFTSPSASLFFSLFFSTPSLPFAAFLTFSPSSRLSFLSTFSTRCLSPIFPSSASRPRVSPFFLVVFFSGRLLPSGNPISLSLSLCVWPRKMESSSGLLGWRVHPSWSPMKYVHGTNRVSQFEEIWICALVAGERGEIYREVIFAIRYTVAWLRVEIFFL